MNYLVIFVISTHLLPTLVLALQEKTLEAAEQKQSFDLGLPVFERDLLYAILAILGLSTIIQSANLWITGTWYFLIALISINHQILF